MFVHKNIKAIYDQETFTAAPLRHLYNKFSFRAKNQQTIHIGNLTANRGLCKVPGRYPPLGKAGI
jgi:hypothetical protein